MEPSDSSTSLIPPSLQTLLSEIIDYAGLFPPADLSLAQAIQNYAEYRDEPERWMLSRFVLPVRRLPDLSPYQNLFADGDPYQFSVLGTGGTDPESFLDAFERDLSVIESFDDTYGGRAQVDVMEVPLPTTLVGSSQGELESFLTSVEQTIVETGTAKLDFFLEIPMRRNAITGLQSLCAAVAEHNSRQAVPARAQAGLKMRCGGGEPSDVPSVEHAAALIEACRNASVPFKATAGLHHPLRHYDDGLDTEMHGFLNIFGAAVLSSEHELSADEIQPILDEESSNNFRFEKESFSWRNISASLEDIRHARDTLAISFGSCSFEEPIDHLRDLELL